MLDWLATERPFDIVNLPYTLLIGLAAPMRRALRRADLLHAAGRGSVSRRPRRAVPAAVARSDSARRACTSMLPSGQPLLLPTTCPAISGCRARRCGRFRSGSTWTAIRPAASARARRRRPDIFHDRLFRARRAGEGAARARRRLPRGCAHAARRWAGRGCWPPDISRPSTRRTSTT